MMEQKKIHIYLPVEIKTRELIPKVILSKIILENKKKKNTLLYWIQNFHTKTNVFKKNLWRYFYI